MLSIAAALVSACVAFVDPPTEPPTDSAIFAAADKLPRRRGWRVPNDGIAPTKPAAIAPLALRPKDAARALGIGQRKLWALTKAGAIHCVKLRTCTLYPYHVLQAWLAELAANGGGPSTDR